MNSLDDIHGLGEKAIALFNAVDISSLDDLSRQETGDLYKLLFETNRQKNIFQHLPPINTVEEWVTAARLLRGARGSSRAGEQANRNGEARAIPAGELTDLPPAEWMRLFESAEEARVLRKPEEQARPKEGSPEETAVQSTGAKLAKHGEIHSDEGLRPSPGSERSRPHVPKKEIELAPAGDLEREFGESRVDKPAEPLPARTRRGLLHPQPKTVYGGAFVAVATRLLFFALLIGMPLGLTVFREHLLYFLAIPALLIVFTVLYAIYASRVRCRVCGAHLLVSRKCLKHENAHRVPGFGYVGSLALHAIFFAWFRCQYCGTPMRLRE